MVRKSSLLVALLTVVAVAVPASAGAAPAATNSEGKLLPVGTLLQITNIGPVTVQTSLGVGRCETVVGTGELTANTGSTVKGVQKGLGSTSACTLGGKPITITDITIANLHSAVVGTGTGTATFIAHLPGGIVCHFESPNVPISVTVGADTLKISNVDLKATPAACEPGLISGEITVEIDGGGAVLLD